MPLSDRPNLNRPTTLPGMVTHRNRPGADRPDFGNGNRPNVGDQNIENNLNINKANYNRKNNYLNRPTNLVGNVNRPNWDNDKWGGNHGVWGNYSAALKSADEAIACTPGDITLHEYRALVLFTLGRYSDLAGVLNPVLAYGLGWGWNTMVGFNDSSGTYSDQLPLHSFLGAFF